MGSPLTLARDERAALWKRLIEQIEEYITRVDSARVSPMLDALGIRSLLAPYTFEHPQPALDALDFVTRNSWQHQVHTPHIHYYGLFNPDPATISIAADALVAAFNPQLAAWSHSPFAVEVEQHLVRAFGGCFGYMENCDGTFTSGGAEANHTALLCALVSTFPEFARQGVRGLDAQPVFYVSSQTHHSLLKAARLCGLGTDAMRETPLDTAWRMDVDSLAVQIQRDREAGLAPFLVVGTAGSTSAGVVDPLPALADLYVREGLWFHVDAAWGGAAALVPELRGLLTGIERADSITFDAHKWLSVPMGAGMILTSHRDILNCTFRISTEYMPHESEGMDITDPYTHSIQWSRRFIGLKVFLSLAVAGWDGYAAAIRHQTAMGQLLRLELHQGGWETVNETELPVVCFRDRSLEPAIDADAIARHVVASGKAWLSTIRAGGACALRACITNHRTGPDQVRELVSMLNAARESVGRTGWR